MEMVEEIQSQVIVENVVEEVDRLSALPDCLLIEILSRLSSTKKAIRTGTLSKIWKHLWTLVPTLIFDQTHVNHPQSDFVSFVDKTLTQCRQLKLKKFRLFILYDIRFESQYNNWIRYAIRCNVEELRLFFWSHDYEAKFLIDQILSTGSCFTHLMLSGCKFNPVGAISWKNLKTLCISYVKLDEDLFENILSGSPVLETLGLHDCSGLTLLDITSKSVKNLLFYGCQNCPETYDEVTDFIKINAPNVSSLKITPSVPFLLSTFDFSIDLDYVLVCESEPVCTEVKEKTLEGIILKLPHVKELKIGPCCSKVGSRLEAKSFVFPSNIKFYKYDDSDSE